MAFGEASTPAFTAYAHQVVEHAKVLAAALAAEGFALTTGGTDTHLITADPAPLGVEGRTARARLAAAGMVLDTCALPYGESRGIRLGTAAVTTQGMGSPEMARIAALFTVALRNDPGETARVRAEVRELTSRFPPYGR
ncbi:serine hydroxymethyltransferase [Streptomyces tanashiensis]